MLGISTTNARVGGFRGLGKIAKLIIAYFARVTAAGGVTEGKECLATKLNSLDAIQLLDNASLVTIPSGYKSGVVYSQVPTSGAGDLDFTRASTATRINSSSLIESVATGVPRLDYPIGGGCPSLLLEPQRTNILAYSDNIALALNVQANTTITSDTAISPDGTQNADNVLFGTSSYRLNVLTISPLTNYTASLFFKNVNFTGAEEFTLNLSDGVFGAITATIIPSNGTATFTRNISGWSSVSGSVINYGNGWYRVSVSGTSIGGGSGWYEIGCNVSKSALIWGTQLEEGTYPTSYIPTTSATVTRVGGTASKTGISSLIGQTEGTIFLDIVVNNIDNLLSNILNTSKTPATVTTLALTKIKANNKFSFELFLGNGGFANIPLLSTNTFQNQLRTKVAIRYKSGDLAMYINGNLEATSSATYTTIGTISELFLNDIAVIFGWQESVSFNQLVFYKSGLTNSQLASLTTI